MNGRSIGVLACAAVLSVSCGRTLVDLDLALKSEPSDAAVSSDAGALVDASVATDAAVAFGDGGVVMTGMTSRHSIDVPLALFGDSAGRTMFVARNTDNDGVLVAQLDENGAMDNSFGVEGVAWSDVVAPRVVARQNDGKYVLVGETKTMRVDAELHVDPGFQVLASELPELGQAWQVVSQSDRKLLAVTSERSTLRVHRFLESGALDAAFDGDGVVAWNAPGLLAQASIAHDPITGRVFAAAVGGGGWNVVAWNDDGSLDTTFASGGILTVVAQVSQLSLRVDDDRTIYIGTYRTRSGTGIASMTHVFANGSVDTAFTSASADNAGTGFAWFGLDRAPNGAWVLATDWTLARLTHAGERDPTFGNDGLVSVGSPAAYPPDPGIVSAPVVDAVARTTVAERAPAELPIYIARYDATGRRDATFGTGGVRELPFFASSESVTALLGMSDGRVLALGEGIAARYTAAGALDSSFGADGTLVAPLVRGAALLANGGVVVAGADRVERWAATGVNEPWFRPLNPIPSASNNYLQPLSVTLDSTQRIVLAGFSRGQRLAHAAVVRLLGTGALDESFGVHGAYDGDQEGTVFTDVAVGGDDAIAAVGTYPTAGRHDLALMRLDADGMQPFGSEGMAVIDATPLPIEVARGVAIDQDGSFVVAGIALASYEPGFEWLEAQAELPFFPDARLVLLRISPDGKLVPSFGQNGVVTGPAWDGFDARDVLVGPDGSIYVAGRWLNDPSARGGFAVVRFTSDGVLDDHFGDDGVFAPFTSTSAARALTLGADGHVFAGGYAARSPTGRDLAVVRLP